MKHEARFLIGMVTLMFIGFIIWLFVYLGWWTFAIPVALATCYGIGYLAERLGVSII